MDWGKLDCNRTKKTWDMLTRKVDTQRKGESAKLEAMGE